MNLPVNPYLHRTTILDDHAFFGRQRELTTVFARIDAVVPQSVSIVGERRVGKSSLLRALLRRWKTSLQRPDEFVFIFLDLQEIVHADVPQFFSVLMEEIGLACRDRAITEQAPTYENMRKLVAQLDRSRLKLVVLLDEFESVTQNPNFTLEYFSFLRSLPNNYGVSFIVTGATAEGTHAFKGSIKPGKLADLVLVDDDPLEVAAERLKSISAVLTVIGGRIAWDAR